MSFSASQKEGGSVEIEGDVSRSNIVMGEGNILNQPFGDRQVQGYYGETRYKVARRSNHLMIIFGESELTVGINGEIGAYLDPDDVNQTRLGEISDKIKGIKDLKGDIEIVEDQIKVKMMLAGSLVEIAMTSKCKFKISSGQKVIYSNFDDVPPKP